MNNIQIKDVYDRCREITEEERKEVSKDVNEKLYSGIAVFIVIAMIAVVAIILVVFGDFDIDLSFIKYASHRTVKNIIKLIICIVIGIIGFVSASFIKTKNVVKTKFNLDNLRVANVEVVSIVEKEVKGYKKVANVKIVDNGAGEVFQNPIMQSDIPILKESAKYVQWQKKGKLYFEPDKCYYLGKAE